MKINNAIDALAWHLVLRKAPGYHSDGLCDVLVLEIDMNLIIFPSLHALFKHKLWFSTVHHACCKTFAVHS